MIFETEVFVRDTIRLNILKELLAGSVSLAVQLNDGTIENYAAQIHSDTGRVKVYGNFNMSESIDGEILTIRPIAVDRALKAVPAMAGELSGKTISVVRSATKTEEHSYPFDDTFMGMELVPSDNKYLLRLEYADTIPQEETVSEMPVTEPVQEAVTENPIKEESQTQEEKLQKIEEEYQKDYDSAQNEIQEYQKRFEIDSTVLEYYKNKDVKPIEDIFKEISDKLNEAEKQIALFIQAKQKKTMEIEGSIKSN